MFFFHANKLILNIITKKIGIENVREINKKAQNDKRNFICYDNFI